MSKKSLVPLALLVAALLSMFFVFDFSSATGQEGGDVSSSSSGGIRWGVWTLPPTISGADVQFFSMNPFERYFIAFSEIGEKRKLVFSKKSVVWTSTDESVAKISKGGVLEAVGKGRATIRAREADSWCFDGAAGERPTDIAEVTVSVGTDDILAIEVEGAAYGFVLPWKTDEKGNLELRARTYPRRSRESINDVEIRALQGAKRAEVFFTDKKELKEYERAHTLLKPTGTNRDMLTVLLTLGDVIKPKETNFTRLGTLLFASDKAAVIDVYEGYSDVGRKLSPITIHVRGGRFLLLPAEKIFPRRESRTHHEKEQSGSRHLPGETAGLRRALHGEDGRFREKNLHGRLRRRNTQGRGGLAFHGGILQPAGDSRSPSVIPIPRNIESHMSVHNEEESSRSSFLFRYSATGGFYGTKFIIEKSKPLTYKRKKPHRRDAVNI